MDENIDLTQNDGEASADTNKPDDLREENREKSVESEQSQPGSEVSSGADGAGSEKKSRGKKASEKKKKKEKKETDGAKTDGSKKKGSPDSSTRALLIAIITVGALMLIVSVVGMVGSLTTSAPQQAQTTAAPSSTAAQSNNIGAQEAPTFAPVQGTDGDAQPTAPETDEQWLGFFNSAVNKIKTQAPGFTKSKQTQKADIELSNSLAQAYVGSQSEKYLSNETVTTDVAKGDASAAVSSVSPDGASYVSALTMSDIKSITHSADANGNYVIRIDMNDCQNPDASSAFAKIFEFMLIDDVMNTYAPDMGATVDRENVTLSYSGCYAQAVITPEGAVVEYETFVGAKMILTSAKISIVTTDLDVTLLSTTKYSSFDW